MEKPPFTPMTQLDLLTTDQSMLFLKLLLPYLPKAYQKFLAIFIKYSGLRNTLLLFQKSNIPEMSKSLNSMTDIINDLQGFLNPKDFETFQMMATMMNMTTQTDENSSDMSDLTNLFDSIIKGETHSE